MLVALSHDGSFLPLGLGAVGLSVWGLMAGDGSVFILSIGASLLQLEGVCAVVKDAGLGGAEKEVCQGEGGDSCG